MREVDADQIDDLPRLLAAKVGQDSDTLELDLAADVLLMVKNGAQDRLHLPRPVVAAGLAGCEDGRPWGQGWTP